VPKARRLIQDGFLLMRDEFRILWLANLFWLALLIPVLTIPLAFAGLYACTHGIVRGESLEWRSFFMGIQKYFGASLRWTLANALVFFVLGFYVWFFKTQSKPFVGSQSMLTGIFLALGLLWWILNMYTFPFMLVQAKPSYWNALRNSAILFFKWPGQAVGITLFNLVIILLSFWLRLPWLVFGATLPALMACLCVKDIVDQVHEMDLAKS
jgi:hypothetical protein